MIILITYWPLSLRAQYKSEQDSEKALYYLDTRGEIYLKLITPDPVIIPVLYEFLSVDKMNESGLYVYANKEAYDRLQELQVNYQVLTPPALQQSVKMSQGQFLLKQWDVYPTFDEYVQMMHHFADTFPEICLLDTIGFSINGREILVAKISDYAENEEDEPDFFYTSTMHGDETTGYILMLRLIDYLLNNYRKQELITRLVDNIQIWINPLANPDGTYFGTNTTVNFAKRYNANNVDLNRNFPDPQDGDHPDNQPWQPENIAMMNFMKSRHLVLSANLHTGAELFNYPWDTWARIHADNNWYRYAGRQYADSVHLYSDNYFTDYDNGITNGFQWYSISGGRQDYVNYFLHGREVTLELSDVKLPDPASLKDYWSYNKSSFLSFIEQCLFGISGTVTDSLTGEPIRANMEIIDHDMDNSDIDSDSLTGKYYRLIHEGIYDIRVTAPGYIDRIIKNVLVTNQSLTILDIKLYKILDSVKLMTQGLMIYPNPVLDHIRIFFKSNKPGTAKISMYDISGRLVIPEYSEPILEGGNDLVLKVVTLPPGTYVFKISFNGNTIKRRVVKIK